MGAFILVVVCSFRVSIGIQLVGVDTARPRRLFFRTLKEEMFFFALIICGYCEVSIFRRSIFRSIVDLE